MRHVPTSLYIDTEVFRRNDLRLDTHEFGLLKDTFVKGGLRLLIPEMMERELFRHYEKRARDSAANLENAQKKHPVSYLSLIDLPPRIELEERCLTELKLQWEDFKEHFTVEQLPLVGDLNDVVNWYFSIEAPFAEGKKRKEFPDAFILSALEHYHEKHKTSIAVISADSDFSKACVRRHFIKYFENLEKYVEAFKRASTSDDLIEEPIDPTVPIVTEDLTELKVILGRGESVTSIEVDRALQLIRSRGEAYRYFFQNNKDPLWLSPLISDGYFKDPPNLVISADGRVQLPFWPEIEYLRGICKEATDEVVKLVVDLPIVDNPRVYQILMDIALELVGEWSVQLKSKMLEYASLEHRLFRSHFPDLLAHWTAEGQTEAALELANILVQFVPDPKEEEKQKQESQLNMDGISTNEDEFASMMTILRPLPRFNENYQKILDNGVRPLAEKEPYKVARILVDATATMIRLGKHQQELDSGTGSDYSEFWCPRLNVTDDDNLEPGDSLVRALTNACEKVYELDCDSIENLDIVLRNQRWNVFKRLRQHLFALHPDEQTLPWIRELILTHTEIGKSEHHFEFQQMTRAACEHFGAELLTIDQRTQIFEAILSGPRMEIYRNQMGEQVTDEGIEWRRRYFHRAQLRMFAPILFGKYAEYLRELEADESANEISDEDYIPYRESEFGWVTSRSPRSCEELANLSDDELLEYVNEWQDEHSDSDDYLTEITIERLAEAFQEVFKDFIIPNADRLTFWMENRHNILRPIYVRAMVDAMKDHVKAKNFDKLDRWIEFCKWVLSHPDPRKEELDEIERVGDRSREKPLWHTSRRAVCDFIEACIDDDVDVPIYARANLTGLLEMLCTQYDWRLDNDRPVLLNRDDQLTEAINTTRGKALDNLIKLGFWVRSHDEKAEVSELSIILEKRLDSESEYPLTLPEYAVLGMHFVSLFDLDEEFAVTIKSSIFPQSDPTVWREAFGNFLRWGRPYRPIFENLCDGFEFAIEKLHYLNKLKWIGVKSASDCLGQHLFSYYVWDVYPLNGNKSLLERFYRKTDDDREQWARLFSYVGNSMRNIGKQLEKGLNDKLVAFFEWRLDAAEPLELREFANWLEAECLDAEWRLNAFLKVLHIDDILKQTITPLDDNVDSAVTSLPFDATEALRAMLPENTSRVVECFAKLTDVAPRSSVVYIANDDARAILKAGFDHENENVRKDAERARENLLRNGLFGILD